METIEEYITELNVMANTYQINTRKVMFPLLESMKKRFNLNLRFVDFHLYSHEWLAILNQEKLRYLKEQNFDMASYFRNMEKKCRDIIEFLDELRITQSTFIYEQSTVFYFCLGWSYVDESIEKFFKELNSSHNQPFKGILDKLSLSL